MWSAALLWRPLGRTAVEGERRAGGSPFCDRDDVRVRNWGSPARGKGTWGLALCERSKMVSQRQHPWDSGTNGLRRCLAKDLIAVELAGRARV